MALTKLNATLDFHQRQDEEPDVPYKTLQQGYDEDVNTIKTYVNDTLTAEIDASLANVPTNAEAVLVTGAQTVAGVKTFSSSPVIPDAINDNEPASKGQLDGIVLGEITDNSLTNAKLATDVKVGSLATLTTTNKDSITDAINEVDAKNDSQDIIIDSNQDRIGISNKVYTGSISGSEVTINTDGNLSDGEYSVPVQFKVTSDVANAELKVDTTSMTVCKDLEGDAISLQANTIYIAYLVDDTTDFFELAPRSGGGIKAIYQGVISSNITLGTTSEINIDNCLVDCKVFASGGDARNSTGRLELYESGGNVILAPTNAVANYTVIEFVNPKIIETDTVTLTTSPTNITLTNTFDITKKVMVGYTYYHPGTAVSYSGMVSAEMTSNTNLQLTSTGTAGGANYGTISYTVVQI